MMFMRMCSYRAADILRKNIEQLKGFFSRNKNSVKGKFYKYRRSILKSMRTLCQSTDEE